MLLSSYFVGFSEPVGNLGVEFLDGSYLKVIYKTSWAEFVDSCKSGMFDTLGEDQVTPHAVVAETVHRRKYHPRLKADPGFCRSDRNGTACLDHLAESFEQGDRLRRLAAQEQLDRVFAARMQVVRLYKRPSTFRAIP